MTRKEAPPNVIWIMGDEFRTDSLSCYGTPYPEIATPHIDKIAESGVRFANCFCNSPICVPSRASEMTARHPEETGVYGNEGSWASYSYDRDLITFPEHFAANGYRTFNFGKTHLPVAMTPWQVDDHTGADLKTFYDGTDPADLAEEVYTPTLKAAIGGAFPDGVVFPGERVTRRALEWIASEAGGTQPFLTRISYLQPHSPVLPPSPYAHCYDNLPWPDAIHGRPGSEYEQRFVDVMQASALDPQQVRRVRADYYALVKWLDDQVGRILDALRQARLLDNTIIVVEADHGVSLGERGRLQKHTFFPEVHRVPRISRFRPPCHGASSGRTWRRTSTWPAPCAAFAGSRHPIDSAVATSSPASRRRARLRHGRIRSGEQLRASQPGRRHMERRHRVAEARLHPHRPLSPRHDGAAERGAGPGSRGGSLSGRPRDRSGRDGQPHR